jgi:hypothetical protein
MVGEVTGLQRSGEGKPDEEPDSLQEMAPARRARQRQAVAGGLRQAFAGQRF